MRLNDAQLAKPEVPYSNTKANIVALSGPTKGSVAMATDTNQLGYYNGSAWIFNGYLYVFTLASPAQTGANTTPISLTNLVWTYEANSIYFFRIMGAVLPGVNTTGCGFQLDVSSAVTEIAMEFFHQLASTGTLTGGHSIADDASVGVSSGTPGTTTGYPVAVFGMLRTGANTGTAQVRFRSETSAAITANAGMTLVVEKVA
jgi:hypothetical protein